MAKRAKRGINESNLSKGEIRKLNALRKSLGDEIANRLALHQHRVVNQVVARV